MRAATVKLRNPNKSSSSGSSKLTLWQGDKSEESRFDLNFWVREIIDTFCKAPASSLTSVKNPPLNAITRKLAETNRPFVSEESCALFLILLHSRCGMRLIEVAVPFWLFDKTSRGPFLPSKRIEFPPGVRFPGVFQIILIVCLLCCREGVTLDDVNAEFERGPRSPRRWKIILTLRQGSENCFCGFATAKKASNQN